MVDWCRDNAALSGLAQHPIRYIVDDCMKFVRREIKRGRRYDALILDPPSYGRGTGGEMWKLEDHLWDLLRECREVMSDRPVFFLLNAYTTGLSPSVIGNLLGELFSSAGGLVTTSEIGLPIASDGKVLPCGISGRWEPGEV
jgi:23S rRNA (cytosine1962-C5)-methyltransferase